MSTADLIAIASSALPSGTRVAAFSGIEGLSRPYELEVFLLVGAGEGDLAGAIGAVASLTIDHGDGSPPFFISGRFATMELLSEVGNRAVLRAVLVPKLWQLSLSRHSRVFTKMSVVDVIKAILDDNQLTDYELRLGDYEPEEHICQYRESDLTFLSRWMEREGIFYFFEHGKDGEKLVLQDSTSYLPDQLGAAVRYHPQAGGDGSAKMSFRTFSCRHAQLPALVKLSDYDYAKPSLDVSASSAVSTSGVGEVTLHGERFFSPSAGTRLAKLRAEELLARQVLYRAGGTRTHLRPGYSFELEHHPRAALDTEYLCVELRHWGNQALHGDAGLRELFDLPHDETYFCEVDAIPATTQFRPSSSTGWPRIFGYENGIVDGPADSEYAQVDDVGRYSVKLNFDESDLEKGDASTFVRMMQPHGGSTEGFHFPLRKGTEVVLSFLGGDPDRPVISGVVPNAVSPSPVTKSNHTKNVIQTGGRNRLEMEDQAGEEQIILSTPFSSTFISAGAPTDGHELVMQTDDNVKIVAGQHMVVDVGALAAGAPPATAGGGYYQVLVEDNLETTVKSGNYELRVLKSNFITHVVEGEWATYVKGHSSFGVIDGNWQQDVEKGNWTTNVEGDATFTVKSGNTKIDTQTGKTEVLSKGTMDLVADGTVTLKSSEADLIIEGGYINMSSRFDVNRIAYANNYDCTYGLKTEIFMGLKTSMALSNDMSLTAGLAERVFIGGTLDMSLAAGVRIAVGGRLEADLAIAMALFHGGKLQMSAGVNAEVDNIKFEFCVVKGENALHDLTMANVKAVFSSIVSFF